MPHLAAKRNDAEIDFSHLRIQKPRKRHFKFRLPAVAGTLS